MSQKHIALVANTAWSMLNFRGNLIRNLLQNHKVTVIAPYSEFGASVKKLQAMGCNYVDININSKGTNPIEDIKLIFRLAKLYKNLQPDIIFHYTIKPNIYGTLAAKIAKIKYSVAVNTGLGYTFLHNNLVSKIARWLYKFSFKYAYSVWFLNSNDLNVFVQHNLVDVHKLMLLNSEGVDIKYFSPQINDKTSQFSKLNQEKQINLIMICRMLWDKGVSEYIQAAQYFKQNSANYDVLINFNLLGECAVQNPSAISHEQIQEWQQQGLINYLGISQDVRQEINNVDCIVLPSYAEGVARTLLEGASMGKVLIASNIPGCTEVVIHGYNGFLCEVKNADSLIAAIESFIQLSQEERDTMGINGRKHIENNFDDVKVIQTYNQLIDKI